MNPAPGYLIVALLGYLLGSISGSLMLGRLRDVDIRTLGSGNAGGTNAFRTQGFIFALGVVLIDVGKSAFATALAWHFATRVGLEPASAAVTAAAAVFLGHVWPLFHGFRGGKGAATVIGALLVLWPIGVLLGMGVWLLVLASSGWVGLSTMAAAFALFLASLAGVTRGDAIALEVGVYLGFVVLALMWTHRANIARMRAGTEHRFDRVRLLRARKPDSSAH